ncbi:MAG: TRAP transporter substrate-binding protein [Alphaproteobacteria bacterium]
MNFDARRWAATALVAAGAATGSSLAAAQEVTLRIHHFVPAPATAHANTIVPWAERVMAQSDGRIKIEIYPTMQLGGAPPQLYDQVRDGVVDIVWTLPGYTRGRFPMIEAFELPFMVSSAEATSQAVQEYYETYAREEFDDIHPIFFHVHARGLFHTRGTAVTSIDDLDGLRIRAPTRQVLELMNELGATPVGMPVPQVPQQLSKGVIDGAVIPYEITWPLKVHELVDYHTEFAGDRGLYTSVFLFAMNKDSYESLPDDLRAIIDANSGLNVVGEIGRIWDEAEGPGANAAREQGNEILTISADDAQAWRDAAQPVIDRWIAEMDEAGNDGQALYDAASALVEKYSR